MFAETIEEAEQELIILIKEKRRQDTKTPPKLCICEDQMEEETRKGKKRVSERILKADLRLSLSSGCCL